LADAGDEGPCFARGKPLTLRRTRSERLPRRRGSGVARSGRSKAAPESRLPLGALATPVPSASRTRCHETSDVVRFCIPPSGCRDLDVWPAPKCLDRRGEPGRRDIEARSDAGAPPTRATIATPLRTTARSEPPIMDEFAQARTPHRRSPMRRASGQAKAHERARTLYADGCPRAQIPRWARLQISGSLEIRWAC